jgi:LPXTG-motif cell wall-anchored protein
MSIINRRNAVLGWSVWQVAKAAGRRKAKQAVPGKGDTGVNKGAVAGLGAATVAALLFWRKKSDSGS